MITTLAPGHCACIEIPDEIRPLTISSGELWSTLYVPQRIKIQDKVEFEGNFMFFILHNKFWILSPGIPKFNVLCLEKYSDQTSWYLLMFDITESPINRVSEGESFSKKFCSRNFSYQPILLLLGAGTKSWYFHFGCWLCNYSDLLFLAI